MTYEYRLKEKGGKADRIVLSDGKEYRIPFYVAYSLDDFSGDEGDYFEYLEGLRTEFVEVQKDLRPGEPNFMAYRDGAESPRYQSDLRVFENVAAQEIVHHRRNPPPQPYSGIAPDENRMKRIKLFEEIRIWEEKEKRAEGLGDHNLADMARFHRRHAEKELNSIPESLFQRQARAEVEQVLSDTVSVLFDKNVDPDDPIWESERMGHDAKLAMDDFNQRYPSTTVLLPKETARCSRKYETIRPGNLIRLNLPDEATKKDFIYKVYTLGKDPHDLVREMGYGKLLESGPDENVSLTELAENPDLMSQRQFEAWRETGKVFEAEDLQSLSRGEFDDLRASKGEKWPGRKPEQVEESEAPEDSDKTWEESLRPVQ